VRLVIAAAALLLLAAPAGAQVYRWDDGSGTLYFWNTPDAAATARTPAPPDPGARPTDPGPAAAPVAPPPGIDPAAAATRIAFSPGSPIVVSARISDSSGSVSLILDTGADRTVIAPQALWRLGISTHNAARAEIRGVTGSGQAELVQVSSLQVGDARVGPLPVVAHDANLRQADGLLGRDFLEHFTVTIDVREQVVILAPR
jgi:hypothetical protein